MDHEDGGVVNKEFPKFKKKEISKLIFTKEPKVTPKSDHPPST